MSGLAGGWTLKILSTLGGALQSLEEAWVTTDGWHDFLCRTSIVANPAGWFCQVRKDWVLGARLMCEEFAPIGTLISRNLAGDRELRQFSNWGRCGSFVTISAFMGTNPT
jgi:hypothetical protein